MHKILVIGLLVGACSGVFAEEFSPQIPPAFNIIMRALDENCPSLVSEIVNRGDMSAVFVERATDIRAVCTCMDAAVVADDRLMGQFKGELREVARRLESGNLKPYVTARFVKAALSCVAEDLEKSLAATALDR